MLEYNINTFLKVYTTKNCVGNQVQFLDVTGGRGGQKLEGITKWRSVDTLLRDVLHRMQVWTLTSNDTHEQKNNKSYLASDLQKVHAHMLITWKLCGDRAGTL